MASPLEDAFAALARELKRDRDAQTAEIKAHIDARLSACEPASATPEFVNSKQAARILGVSNSSMEGWRARGVGPVYCKIGAAVRYSRADIEAFAQARKKGKAK